MSTTSGYRRHTGTLSRVISFVTWIVVVILVLGIVLTWADANRANDLVDAVMDAGEWLAQPFDNVFTPDNAKHALYENWALAAVVYYALGSALSWLTRRF